MNYHNICGGMVLPENSPYQRTSLRSAIPGHFLSREEFAHIAAAWIYSDWLAGDPVLQHSLRSQVTRAQWAAEHLMVCEMLRSSWPDITKNPTETWQRVTLAHIAERARIHREDGFFDTVAIRCNRVRINPVSEMDENTLHKFRHIYCAVIAMRANPNLRELSSNTRLNVYAEFLLCAGIARWTKLL